MNDWAFLPPGQSPEPLSPPATRSRREAGSSQINPGAPGKRRECVHLLVCVNLDYFQHAAICLASLLANNPELSFNIVVVGRLDETLDETKLRRSLAFHADHTLSFRRFAPPQECVLPLNPKAHYTVDVWTRLWVADFFADDVRRVLYLDSDLVVTGSIVPLWTVELEGALLAAVDIPGSPRGVSRHGLRPEDGYFNSGVMVIDLEQWRRTNALGAVLEFVAAHPDRVPDVDQDALNACFYHRRKRLEYRWNAIRPFFREPLALPLPRAEIEAVRRDARVIHFNGASKPWSYFCDHPRKQEYDKYLRVTEWRDFVPADKTALNILRKGLSSVLPRSVKATMKAMISSGRPWAR